MIRKLTLAALIAATPAGVVVAQDAPSPSIGWLVENCLGDDNENADDLCKAFRNGIRYQMRASQTTGGTGDQYIVPPGLGGTRAIVVPESVVVSPPTDPGYIVK